MSAESPSRRCGSSARCVPTVIPPQAVSDRSIIDSVTGFINEVALHGGAPPADAKEQIIWSRFETDADISDLSFGEDWDLEEGSAPPPLILTLGYGTGIQMWAIPANGEAIEVLSWRQGGPVKCLKILPTPLLDYGDQSGGPVVDVFHSKRPLIAIADTAGNIVNFVSLRDGDTVKSIKFKHPVTDILANRTTVVIAFQERIAVFDARTFEDRCTVTTCFPSPGLSPNPVALGARWMAYAELKLMPSKRSNGGCDGLVNTSTMASVISAAKTLGKGLKGIGETIGLTQAGVGGGGVGGGPAGASMGHPYSGVGAQYTGAPNMGHPGLSRAGSSGGLSPSGSTQSLSAADGRQAGVITVLDIKYAIKDVSPTSGTPVTVRGTDPMIAHFVAHSEAVVNIAFDPSGMLLLTADRKGHDFNLFRIYPHPGGPALAAVHHLYVLHRGDTTAKVQDICFSMDSRWVAVSSLRGTTHVFPITPYGGNVSIRTHGSSHVVNQLSRFHRSAGLSMDGRCSSPVTHSGEGGSFGSQSSMPSASGAGQNGHYQNLSNAYANPRIPPFAHPTIVLPLTQLRQPYSISSSTAGAAPTPHVKDYLFNVTLGRQRHSSLSDDSMMAAGGNQANPLRVCATFARPRAWLLDPPGINRDASAMRMNKSVMDSLFVMASHGAMIQYDLEPKHVSSVARDKVCDDTPIELFVEAKAQWNLLRNEAKFNEIQPPLPPDNLLLLDRLRTAKVMYGDERGDHSGSSGGSGDGGHDDRWLSQVEIITHAGPHRRLWMGPQFIFKTYNTPSGSNLHHIEVESVEIGLTTGGAASLNGGRPARSNPVNMPGGAERPIVPVFIESGSYSSYEQSPRFRSFEDLDDFHLEPRDSQLREDLADAMRDCSTGGYAAGKDSGSASASSAMSSAMSAAHASSAHHTLMSDSQEHRIVIAATAAGSGLRPASAMSSTSIENIVNPLGTVTTVVRSGGAGGDPMVDSYQSSDIAFPDQYIHENCDEALFRPVVQLIEQRPAGEVVVEPPQQPPVRMPTNLIVPVVIPTPRKVPPPITAVASNAAIVGKEVKTDKIDPPPATEEVQLVAEVAPAQPEPTAVVIHQMPKQSKQSKQKNKRNKGDNNKEKSPPLGANTMAMSASASSVALPLATTAPALDDKAGSTKSNGSKGRKSSWQEPKTGKMRKSEIVNSETAAAEEEECVKEAEREVFVTTEPAVVVTPSPPPPLPMRRPTETRIETDLLDPLGNDDDDEVETVEMPSKREMELIQDSLMKDTIVETVTLPLPGGTKKKKDKNRQKTPPKVDLLANNNKAQEMIVDISETNYDLAECIGQQQQQQHRHGESEFEGMYTDPLVPLEPFDPVTFESLECPTELPVLGDDDDDLDDQSLMTFESPVLDDGDGGDGDKDEVAEKLPQMFTDRNLIFALCTSLREGAADNGDDDEVNISSAPDWQLEIHEDYMDLDRSEKRLMLESSLSRGDANKLSPILTGSTGSSEGEVSSSCSTGDGKTTGSGHTTTTATEDDEEGGERKKRGKSCAEEIEDEDEELQPLIKGSPFPDKDNEDVEGGGESLAVPLAAAASSRHSSKESTPTTTPGNKGAQQSSKKKSHFIDGSGVLSCFHSRSRHSDGLMGGAGGGGGGGGEDMSSSSFSSTDAPSSSPTASYNGESQNLLHFHGDSSGSL